MNFGVKTLLGILILLGFLVASSVVVVAQEQSLKVVYPPPNHQTTADQIFFIGTAPPTGQVLINGKLITRSKSGHFAPSIPLQLGENNFTVNYQNQAVQIQVKRLATEPELPQGLAFAKDSLTPTVDIARLPGELICFSAIAPPYASVSVKLGNQTIPLSPQPQQAQLPGNLAALTGRNQPTAHHSASKYEGCTTADDTKEVDLGKPQFQLTLNDKTITQEGQGKITILSPAKLQVVEVTANAGVARTGPSTDYSRLTPLPKGTRAAVTAREGEWLRLDYGGWINSKETTIIPGAIPPRSIIRSVGYRPLPNAIEMVFPLQVPVPVSVKQSNSTFTVTLYNTTAQTDIIRLDDNPLISRLDWQQVTPEQVQYSFNLKKDQQWGYHLKYNGTSLVLSLRKPPVLPRSKQKPLTDIKILLDPGHGGKESGARGPTGYLEKDVNLKVSKLVRDELNKRGATVVMTREDDKEVSLPERQAIIDREQPAIAISIHYNSLPDDGDAENTKGVGTFWYHPQAHSLAVFMHNSLVKKLKRPSYGVFWNNLALTRPASAPSVLLELGFMINPDEFEWVTNEKEQKKLARAIADGIVEWFKKVQ
ncbi:N-acetylmuramoyl-L-alanine amidase [Fischerella sp. PCC 9605]|uniref:N-acetylmuramoyl-L-alanine amidase n=1 Tax=Fischerella sp. PCC 9605 TaxID=1173024 RepID=UPI00047A4316|nr:N-acetylmuramoyl-L-alanine amidase [Fischerella sp. PCC 9605]